MVVIALPPGVRFDLFFAFIFPLRYKISENIKHKCSCPCQRTVQQQSREPWVPADRHRRGWHSWTNFIMAAGRDALETHAGGVGGAVNLNVYQLSRRKLGEAHIFNTQRRPRPHSFSKTLSTGLHWRTGKLAAQTVIAPSRTWGKLSLRKSSAEKKGECKVSFENRMSSFWEMG